MIYALLLLLVSRRCLTACNYSRTYSSRLNKACLSVTESEGKHKTSIWHFKVRLELSLPDLSESKMKYEVFDDLENTTNVLSRSN